MRASLFALLLSAAVAQPALSAASDRGAWLIVSASGAIGDAETSSWNWSANAQLRYFGLGDGFYDNAVFASVGYAVNESVNVRLGYARFLLEGAGDLRRDENRPWQQVDWRTRNVAGGTVTLRARAEQRDVTFGNDIRHVLRLSGSYGRSLQSELARDWFLRVEAFTDMNESDWGGDRGLSQHRVHVGIGVQPMPRLRLEAGLMQQYFWAERGEDRVNYLGMLALRWRF